MNDAIAWAVIAAVGFVCAVMVWLVIANEGK